MIFSHTNRFDSLTDFSQIRKTRFCIFCIDACSTHSMHYFSYRFLDHLTYFMDFLQSNCIDIESLMSQTIFENFEIHNDVIKSWCDSHSRQYRTTQTIDICFMMYFSVNSRYQISHRRRISRKVIIKTSQFFNSIARFANRFYVIFQVITCIEFRFVRFCNLRIDAWFSFRIYHIEKVCSKASNNASLKKSEFASLKKSHRWKSLHESFKLIKLVKIQSRWHKRLLWKNVENTIFANVLQSKFNWYNLTKEKLMRFCWN